MKEGARNTTHASELAPPGRWPVEPDFWRLWLIGTIQFGVRWFEMLAIGIFVYQDTGSAFLVTLLTLLRVLPLALFGEDWARCVNLLFLPNRAVWRADFDFGW